jgi:hypothetical protein
MLMLSPPSPVAAQVTLFPHVAYFDRMPDKTTSSESDEKSEYSQEKNVYLGSLANPKEIYEFGSQAARPPVYELDPETIEKHVYVLFFHVLLRVIIVPLPFSKLHTVNLFQVYTSKVRAR